MGQVDQIIKVGIADMNVVTSPQTIRTSGLGSCVGVVIFDSRQAIAGLAHVMLPDSSLARTGTLNLAKYADTAIEELIKQIVSRGGRSYGLQAKIAGGAQMFPNLSGSDMMRIGPRNVEAVLQELTRFKVTLLSSDVGGNLGRTIEFDPVTTSLTIRTVNQGVKSI
ncbi:chemotaxis protein CheD [Bacillus sp. PS06]|uniref:chemotaxis protein CheD n=1 Tax=Bacillus sp. PS06 TaxID=2764176 RepID=UPI001780CAA2|nr:chemotaxis protein CheD [Bacillus sp. PS06]MBD8068276.1 chemotaxis protein CheD [Bacillus sp. PS06]